MRKSCDSFELFFCCPVLEGLLFNAIRIIADRQAAFQYVAFYVVVEVCLHLVAVAGDLLVMVGRQLAPAGGPYHFG